MTSSKRQCELCQKSLAASDYCICQVCSTTYDHWRVWSGRKMSFNVNVNSEQQVPKKEKQPKKKVEKPKKISEKKQRGQMQLV